MKLSACLIVKNEEENIERCLLSIYDHVDEIVVVDTGSEDKTIDKLLEFQHRANCQLSLHEIPWNGSFADMRNKSMDLATGDYILIIDADEYVEDGWEYIREAINTPHFICGQVHVLNTVGKGPVRGERIMQPRIFLNHKDIRYTYKIHNQIDEQVKKFTRKYLRLHGQKGVICGIDAQIIHTGYNLTPQGHVKKYTERVKACREAIAEAVRVGNKRDENYYRFQLALFLTVMGQTEDTIALWEEIEWEHLNRYNLWYGHYIAARALLKQELVEESLSHCAQMFYATYGDVNDAPIAEEAASWMITGVVLLELQRFELAIAFLTEAWLKNLTPQFNTRCVLNNNLLLSDIRAQFEEGSEEALMLSVTDPQTLINNVKQIQRRYVPFDASLLELVDREYA